jgi:hypothetical protein
MTTQIQPHTGADIWTPRGPFRFTREQVITSPAAERLYRLYRRAFEPLRTRAATRRTSFLDTIVRLCALAAERALISNDICSYNNDTLGFSTRIAEMLTRFSHSQPQELDSQIYYVVDFA